MTCWWRSGRRMRSPGSSATSASTFDKWDMPVVDEITFESTHPQVFFGGDCGVRPEEHHLGGGARPPGGDVDPPAVPGPGRHDRPPPMVTLAWQKMGIHEWSYDNDISLDLRFKVPHRDKAIALRDIKAEVELGFDDQLAFAEAQRCLNCDVQTVFTDKLCIECDACVDICPVDCITFTRTAGGRAAHPPDGAGAEHHSGPVCVRRSEDRPGDGEGRGRVPSLRPVRRALPDRRLGHAAVPSRYRTGGARMLQIRPRTQGATAWNASTTSSSSSPTSTARARPAPTRCSPSRSCAWACR